MVSAFPEEQRIDTFGPAMMGQIVEERGQVIPAWYVRNPHRDPDVVVKVRGVPLPDAQGRPFTIGQVAPECRWPVGLDGEVMDQVGFDELKRKSVLELYEILRAQGHDGAQYKGKIQLEPVPDVHEFVSWGIDPEDSTRWRRIGYDPSATDGALPEVFHDKEGEEIAKKRLDVLCEAYANPKAREAMKPHEIAEVEKHLEVSSSAGTDGIAARLEVLTELFNAGEIGMDFYAQRVAALTGKGISGDPDEIEVATEPQETDPFETLCGKTGMKGNSGKLAHERRCKQCLKIAGKGGEA